MKEIKLSSPQFRFIQSDKRYVLFAGGYGCGKTYAGAVKLLKNLLKYPKSVGLIVRKTYTELIDTSGSEFLGLAEDYIVEFNKTLLKGKLVNGSEFLMRSADKPEKFKSLNLNFIWIDEASELSLDFFTMLLSRLRLPPVQQIFLTTNPTSKQHWIYKVFIDEKTKYDDLEVIKATSFDSVSLSPEVLESYLKIREVDEDLFRREILGEFGSFEGTIFKPLILEDRVLARFLQNNRFSYYIGGVDFGFVNPNAFVLIGKLEQPVGFKKFLVRYIVIRELYERGIQTDTFGEMILSVLRNLHIEDTPIICDSAEPDRIQILNDIGLDAYPVKKIGVKDSIVKIKNFLGDPVIIKGCENFIRELEGYRWNEKEMPNAENGDHLIDAFRYAMLYELERAKVGAMWINL